ITDGQGKRAGLMLVAPDNFYCPGESGGGSTVTVTTFNLNDTSYPWQGVGLAADVHTVYAATGSLYLSATRRNYTPGPLTTGVSVAAEETVIHKFDLNGDKTQSMGSGKVPGRLLNQFSMGEYEGVLRVATTTGSAWGSAPASANHVFCLKSGTQGLEVIGKLENLASGERIYSARFIGKRGFLVTFVQIDPLFTLDLSDPAAPKVAGVLKVPGYSDYIHPWDENHLITIGKSVKLENAIAWYQGIQLSMFDITDFTNPKLLHKELIGIRGTESEALHNHKAFTYWNEKNLLALPIQLYEYQRPPAAASDGGTVTFIGLYGYRVGLEKGFELLGRIRTVTDTANPSLPYHYQAWMRGLFIGDMVYAVQPDSVSSARIDDIGGTVKRITIDN
ncbi:MAG: beta-propeller domain-containing protein, partial [Pseudomonadota bacterium]